MPGRSGGGRGNGIARQLVAEADGISESILETAGRLALSEARLPLPTAQFQVFDGANLVRGAMKQLSCSTWRRSDHEFAVLAGALCATGGR